MLPKFLVCTLHSGEPDYNACVRSVVSQVGVTVEHKIISGLKELAAHNAAYQAFNEAGDEWIRAKVDADVELLDRAVFQRIAASFNEIPLAHGITPLVHDYITDSELHAGVMFYTHHVKFAVQTNPLKCDRGMVFRAHEHYIKPYAVVGKHMHYANELTAFRYGFHRGLKGQADVLELAKRAYQKHGDRTRLFAIKGFEAAQSPAYAGWHSGGSAVPADHNYGDVELMRLFNECVRG